MYQPGLVENPQLTSVKSLLNVTKILCLVFWILGILWVLGSIYTAFVVATVLGYGGYAAWNVAYPVVFTILNLLIWIQVPGIETLVATGQYSSAKERTILWAILGIFAGLIPGILLIVVYTKFDMLIAWRAPMMGQPGPQMGWSPQPVPQPQVAWSPTPQPTVVAAAPVAQPPPVAPAPASGTACPRCGNAATWIAQYNRWYCYSCQQYV